MKKTLGLLMLFALSSPALADGSIAEARRQHKFFLKFTKYYNDIADAAYDLVDGVNFKTISPTENTQREAEFQQEYQDVILTMEEHGEYAMAREMMAQHALNLSGSLYDRYQIWDNQATLDQAQDHLMAEIQKAGGFAEFEKIMDAEKMQNRVPRCRLKKVVASILTPPAAAVIVVVGAATGPVGGVVAVGAGGPVIGAGAGAMFGGCYKIAAHPDFVEAATH